MSPLTLWQALIKLDRLVFTTREVAALMGASLSSASQALCRLEEKRIVSKILRGLWGVTSDKRFSPLMLVPFLDTSHQSYVSFITALHLHGMIRQIPQMITVASTAHSKTRVTPVGVFKIHQIDPGFFTGFEWHSSQNFLMATPEKALVDCFYLASRRGRQYELFPELEVPPNFNRKEVKRWVSMIKDERFKKSVMNKLLIPLGAVALRGGL